ncbi:MAG: SH3 domain-containing protein [Leptolyngbyaceae cyanobacterium SM2_3_12]|nr:SH3 domain-containing protein [Leptolyngbyaceae cyanobacterium SM2_3_12]
MIGTTLNPPQKAQLIAAQPEAQINLRSQPSTDSRSKGYGLVGDPVQLLRSAQDSDGREWYYVKFEQSGAEGWVRGDFINTAGRATPLPQRAAQGSECTGLLEALAFTAFYDASGFNLIRFTNLETKSTFDSPLSPQGGNPPTYSGSASPPTGGTLPVQLTDQSGGNPGGGSQVTLNYAGMAATGTCQ